VLSDMRKATADQLQRVCLRIDSSNGAGAQGFLTLHQLGVSRQRDCRRDGAGTVSRGSRDDESAARPCGKRGVEAKTV
jgi:hypothetical protein